MARNLRHLYRLSCQQLPVLPTTRTLKVQQYSKFTSGNTNLTTTMMTDTDAYNLVLNLDESERTALKSALNKLESNVTKQQLEGKFIKIVHDSLDIKSLK